MNDFKKKDKTEVFIRKIVFSPAFLILFFIIFAVFSVSTLRIYLQSRKLHKERLEKETMLETEKQKNKELKQKIDELKTPDGFEKNLRENMQVKKPGEEVVVILNPKEQNNEKNKKENEKNIIIKIWKLIFD